MTKFIENILLTYGEKGESWIKNLPMLQLQLASQFALRELIPFPNLSFNYVASGFKESLPIILKVGIDHGAIEQEFNALAAFKGFGVIELVENDLTKGALILTRAMPGATLTTLFPQQDMIALKIACDLIHKMQQARIPTNAQFPLLSKWLSIIDKYWDLPSQLLARTRKIKQHLLSNSNTTVLLHGDPHYDNVLLHGNQWLLIDPKGVIGDPLYDMCGCLLREPLAQMLSNYDTIQMLSKRILFVANYNKITTKIIWDWTYLQTIMSICWSLEDGHDISKTLEFANVLLKIENILD